MKKNILILSIFLSSLVFADVKYVTTTGYGSTKTEAVTEALTEAIKQTKGVSINSKKEYILGVNNSARSENDENFQSTKIEESFRKKIKEKTSGMIDGYDIVSIEKDNNEYRVSVKVGIYEYKTPGLSHKGRIKLAIYPFNGRNNVNRKQYDSILESLVGSVTQSRKFAVLNRLNDNTYKREKAFVSDENARKKEKEKLAKRLGADYTLSGKINYLKVKSISRGTSITGSSSNTTAHEYEVSFLYNILAFSTGQIKWSDTIVLKGIVPENYKSDPINFVSKHLGKKLVKDMIANIYPLRVLQISDANYAVINQGANTLEEGESFDVFALGKQLVDTYTGESLGYEEIKTGKVIIERVNPKVSYAKIIEGRVVKGSIVRASKIKTNNTMKKKNSNHSNVSSSGGIKL